MTQDSFYWHDYETFGADPRRDRPVQFAGVRTDLELQPIGDPTTVYCRPTDDYLPHPQAVMITGITPQMGVTKGLPERDFVRAVIEQLGQPGTCGLGYNSIRFDDEVTRFALYRNFYDPYEREYRNGNSRWDLIDVVRLCYALRPQGLNWPTRDDGCASFRLEHLTQANDIDHGQAHDALADVYATIELARRLRDAQPRLFHYAYANRGKQACRSLLDFANLRPVLHVSSRYSARRGCLAMVAPLCAHPTNANAVIVYDLAADPAALLELDAADIADRVFTPTADLPEGVERIGLKSVAVNHAPVLVPVSTLKGVDLERIAMDPDLCRAHLRQLQPAHAMVAEKVRTVFQHSASVPAPADPEWTLYHAGFPTDKDRRLLAQVRVASADQLATLGDRFEARHLRQLILRYRARNFPQSLDISEQEQWLAICRDRILAGQPSALATFDAAMAQLRANDPAGKTALLDQLQAWRDALLARIDATDAATDECR